MNRHLSPERISELRAGLLTGRRARIATRHLDRCPECAQVSRRLGVVETALAAAPPPPPLPPGLASRLDQALAAESIESQRHGVLAPGTSARTHPARLAGLAGWARRIEVRWRPVLGAGAVAAAIAGLLLGVILTGSGGSTEGTAASGGARTGSISGQSGGMARPLPSEASNASSSSAETSGSSAASGAGSSLSSRAPAASRDNETELRPGTLAQQVTALIHDRLAGEAAAVPAPPAQAGCVRVLERGASPVLAEMVRYSGKPAVLVVVRDGSRYRVTVAQTACTKQRPRILASTVVPVSAAGLFTAPIRLSGKLRTRKLGTRTTQRTEGLA